MDKMRQYGKDNWIEIHTRIPWRRSFMFVDTKDYIADHIFIQHEIRVRFRKGEFGKEESPFRMIFCSVKAQDADSFIACMADLHRAILLSRHKGYEDACEVVRTLKDISDKRNILLE